MADPPDDVELPPATRIALRGMAKVFIRRWQWAELDEEGACAELFELLTVAYNKGGVEIEVKEALSKLRLGSCRFCGRDVTESDAWNSDGPLDAYPPVKTTVYHLSCLFTAGLQNR